VCLLLTAGPAGRALSLRGRAAVVTGGGKGIGAHIVRALAEAGANVAIGFNTSREAAQEMVREVENNYGVKAMAVSMPATDSARIEEAIGEIMLNFGRLDIVRPTTHFSHCSTEICAQVVANAGIGAWFNIAGADVQQWRDIVGTNYDGVFYLARVVGPYAPPRPLLYISLTHHQHLQESGIRLIHRECV
jgi:sorbose reductase